MRIRRATEGDLESLEEWLGLETPERHRERIALQSAGEALYLIAWEGGLPVGHLLLRWSGAPAGTPEIEDLLVLPQFRSRGLGTALLAEAESACQFGSIRRVCLCVGRDNHRARALYQRLGYRESRSGRVDPGALLIEPSGRRRDWSEAGLWLVKELGGPART